MPSHMVTGMRCRYTVGCAEPIDARGMCKTHYVIAREQEVRNGTWQCSYVDATEVRDHIANLRASGIGLRRLSGLTCIPRVTLYHLASGHRPRVSRRVAAVVLKVRPMFGHHLAADGALVDATGSIRRVRALSAIGYPSRAQCAAMGVAEGNLSPLFAGTRTAVCAAKARRIELAYDQLSGTPGPSARTRRHAAAKGWAPPLAWDENTIDDPNAEPDVGEATRATFVEKYSELRDLGYIDDSAIAQKLGMTDGALERQLHRVRRRARRSEQVAS